LPKPADVVRAVALAGVSACAGCVAAPFVTLPVRASATLGRAFPPREAPPPSPSSGTLTAGVRVTVHPLAMVRSLLRRPADVGVGYVFDTPPSQRDGPPSRDLHGACVDASLWPWRIPLQSGRRVVRIGLAVRGELLVGQVTPHAEDVGFGVLAGPEVEFVCTADGVFSSRSSHDWVHGWALGEIGFTASLMGTYRAVGDASWWSVVFGLGFRLPASAGIAAALIR
jgi:hypothetical protein